MNSKHLLFGLLLFSVFGWGQINFEVSVSKKQLGLNERLRVDFKIDKPGDNFRPPKFSSFRVISGPMQSVSNVFVNGKRTYSMTYTYFLMPLQQGVYDIEQAQIEYEGNTYKTTPVTINVTEAVAIPRPSWRTRNRYGLRANNRDGSAFRAKSLCQGNLRSRSRSLTD